MAKYSFVTVWRVAAQPEHVWDAIAHPLAWPSWWKGVESVEELEAGAENGLGALHRYTWKSALPYRLAFDMRVSTVDEPRLLEGTASGELAGTGRWTFTPEPGGTLVRYAWDIETTRPWMNVLAPLLRPAFEWNHDWVMNSGARGLAAKLGVPAEIVREEHKRGWWPVAAVAGALSLGGLAMLARRRSA
jgi:uncharacterized protein YndB with AHSA1/START domain